MESNKGMNYSLSIFNEYESRNVTAVKNTVLVRELMWEAKVSEWSKIAPRLLSVLDGLTRTPSMLKHRSECLETKALGSTTKISFFCVEFEVNIVHPLTDVIDAS